MRSLESSEMRIVPQAEVTSSKLLGEPTRGRGTPSQRELPTEEVRPETVQPSGGQALSEAPAGRQRRLSVALVVGLVAWLLAIVVAYLALRGPDTVAPAPLQIESSDS